MPGKEKQIASVKSNTEKQKTYREQLSRYKKAVNNEFYYEALLIVYAMMEDRMRSFLYYIGALRRSDDSKLNVSKTKKVLRRLYFGSDEAAKDKRIDLNQISAKERLLRTTLLWTLEQEGVPEDPYLSILKREYEGCIDIGGLLEILDHIDQWRAYRNEIIHGLLNKNSEAVKTDLREKVEAGMSYARFIDNQIKALKKRNNIRKTLYLQIDRTESVKRK